MVLLWTSTVWTGREKAIGTLVLPGGLAPAYLLITGAVGGFSCVSVTASGPNGLVRHSETVCNGAALPTWLAWVVLAVLVGAPVVTALWLGKVAARRAAARS